LVRPQIKIEIETLKQTSAGPNPSVWSAREKQTEATEECRKLEKDMDKFKNNKKGKLEGVMVRFFVSFFVFYVFFGLS
jgi:hypothetical protein